MVGNGREKKGVHHTAWGRSVDRDRFKAVQNSSPNCECDTCSDVAVQAGHFFLTNNN